MHDSLTTPVEILVPTLPAYAIGKLLSSAHRHVRAKQAKDLVYVTELTAREQLATLILEGIPQVIASHPDEGRRARQWLSAAIHDRRLIEDAASQVVESSGFGVDDHRPVRAEVVARLRRLSEEGWP